MRITYVSCNPDRAGNVYHAITVQHNGKTVSAKISGDNARRAIFELCGQNWETVRELVQESEERLTCREFDKFTRELPYAGCEPKQIADWISQAVNPNFDPLSVAVRSIARRMAESFAKQAFELLDKMTASERVAILPANPNASARALLLPCMDGIENEWGTESLQPVLRKIRRIKKQAR